MKFVKTSKWLFKQSKPFIFQLLLIVVIGMISTSLGIFTAIASKNLIDYAVDRNTSNAIFTLVFFLITVLLQIVTRAFFSISSTRISEKYTNKLRLSIYKKIVNSNWYDFIKYHSDDILTRLTSDISVVSGGIIDVIPNIITLGIQLVLAFFTLFFYDKILAILAITLSPLFILFYRLFRVKMKKLHIKIQEAEGIYRAYLHECIQNNSILKVFSLEQHSSNRLNNLQENRTKLVIERNKISVTASSILSLGYYLGFILSFAWGAYKLSLGLITFGTLTIFFQLVGQVQGPFVSIVKSIPSLIAMEGSAARLMELENIPQEKIIRNSLPIRQAGIEFSEIAFQYEKDRVILKNINAKIKPGEIVSIIGPSGEGKTTLVRLVLSLLEQNQGSINLVDIDKKYQLNALCRDMISYVPQGNTLFSGSIYENIIVGKPTATDEEVIQVIKETCCFEFVSALKDGIHTVIGEKGLGLSEGQAQRLTIARALLRNAPILILDEATSALDEETELKILNVIKAKDPRPTCLLITHRPTVYNLTDRVLRLKNGVLIEKTVDNVSKANNI